MDEAQSAALVLPTAFRHVEVFIAIVIWLGILPVVYFIRSAALNCLALLLVIFLVAHAYSLRPFCTELNDEEEETIGDALAGKQAAREGGSAENQLEEWKLVSVVMVLLCGIASVVALSVGGARALRVWTAPMVFQCSIADLDKSVQRFHCKDGFLDKSQEQTLMLKGGLSVGVGTYTVYRMVPIYLSPRDRDKNSIPIAWGVTQNAHIVNDICGQGVCGISPSLDSNPEEIASFAKLAKVLGEALVSAGANEFDSGSIPTVILVDPNGPEGTPICFIVGAVFYVVVLSGLCFLQFHMHFEAPSKADLARHGANNDPSELESGYENLNS